MRSDVDQNPLLKRLFAAERRLAQNALAFDLKIRETSPELKERMADVAEPRLTRACENLELTAKVLAQCVDENVDARDDREFFRLSMRALKAVYPPGFLDSLTGGYIVEAYDLQQFQVFRNFNFMESCSYSLAEVMSFEWYELFERPKRIVDELMIYATERVWAANRAIPVSIPVHHLREHFGSKQVVRCEFKSLAPLFAGPGRPFGIIAIMDAMVLPVQAGVGLDFM